MISSESVELILLILLFISGTFIGSFLNVVSDRIVSGESILFGRSHCDFCNKALRALDMIPIISFLKNKARCYHCDARLSNYYPVSEVLTGVTFALLAYLTNIFDSASSIYSWAIFTYFLIMFSFYIVLFLTDVKYRLLPDKIVFTAIGFVTLFILLNTVFVTARSYFLLINDDFGRYLVEAGYWHSMTLRNLEGLLYTLISTGAIGVFFYILTRIKNGNAMGGGDLKLAILIGIFNGFPQNILAIFLGFLIGAIYSLLLIALRIRSIKDTIPFGPFLILGSVISVFYGSHILNWYLSLHL